jgi:Holliday junction resolvase RusA-like endonuclease
MTNQHTPAEPVFVYADGTPIQEPPPSHWEAYQATGRTTLERLHDPDWERRQRLQTAYGPSALVVIAYGKPTQQGSKNRGRNGGLYESANDALVPWREAVKHATMDQRPDTIRKPTPVHLIFATSRERPTAHYGTGRNAGIIKPQYLEAEPTTMPDGDKLERAIYDALKWGGAYQDDSQITRCHGWAKCYATPGSADLFVLDRPGAVIVLWPKQGAT